MEHTNPTRDLFRPGKQGVNIPLDERMMTFLFSCSQQMAKAFVNASTPQGMLDMLGTDEFGSWQLSNTGQGRTTYKNRWRSIKVDKVTEYRFMVTYDSNQRLTYAIRQWYLPIRGQR